MSKESCITLINLLGLPLDLTEKDIKREYRKFMLNNHPDRNSSVDENKIKNLNSSYNDCVKKQRDDSSSKYSYSEEDIILYYIKKQDLINLKKIVEKEDYKINWDGNRNSALYVALENYDEKIVKFLIDKGAYFNDLDQLLYSKEIFNFIIKYDLSYTITEENLLSFFREMRKEFIDTNSNNFNKIIKDFYEFINVDDNDWQGFFVNLIYNLIRDDKHDNIDKIEILLNIGAHNFNDHHSLLYMAALCERSDIVTFLAKNNITFNYYDLEDKYGDLLEKIIHYNLYEYIPEEYFFRFFNNHKNYFKSLINVKDFKRFLSDFTKSDIFIQSKEYWQKYFIELLNNFSYADTKQENFKTLLQYLKEFDFSNQHSLLFQLRYTKYFDALIEQGFKFNVNDFDQIFLLRVVNDNKLFKAIQDSEKIVFFQNKMNDLANNLSVNSFKEFLGLFEKEFGNLLKQEENWFGKVISYFFGKNLTTEELEWQKVLKELVVKTAQINDKEKLEILSFKYDIDFNDISNKSLLSIILSNHEYYHISVDFLIKKGVHFKKDDFINKDKSIIRKVYDKVVKEGKLFNNKEAFPYNEFKGFISLDKVTKCEMPMQGKCLDVYEDTN